MDGTPARARECFVVIGLDPDDQAIAFPSGRADVVAAIATLPDEAFGFVCGMLDNIGHEAGGFQNDSRAALVSICPVVKAYFASKGNP